MLHFVEKGQGNAMVFIHAFPLDHTMWQAQVDFFAHRYRVITPDVLGFGGSQPVAPWTIPQMGEELRALLDRLTIEKCLLVGLSMGGYISLPFAAVNPDRVEKLVLAHTRARADTDVERAARNDMISALRKDGIPMLAEKMLSRLLGPHATNEVREWVRHTIERTNPEAAIHAVTAMRDRADATALLERIECPTLVIHGDSDAIIKPEDSEKMAAAMPHGKLVVIPNTGHLSNLEDPAAFNRAVVEFLASF